MTLKPKVPPLCRYCGKAIRKRTETVYFGDGAFAKPQHRAIKPKTIEEAQRHINHGKIVSIRWQMTTPPEFDPEFQYRHEHLTVRDHIDKVSVWDGESYVDQFFCNGDHAQKYAYAMARSPHNTLSIPAYREALKKQQSE